ncbi:hypothetical protein F1559_000664 [Cyanidiococcus yangmingshanensis]|uniref:Uncharacterized protein n=1 Tax=Cyanidiococcus yangmingshanensis TaxID=2690220 RepID=A0A7J7IIX2_9RHOD|nr:hypothetical protein F1559_000664 [Cyanidiococcus yangmingshanensis]
MSAVRCRNTSTTLQTDPPYRAPASQTEVYVSSSGADIERVRKRRDLKDRELILLSSQSPAVYRVRCNAIVPERIELFVPALLSLRSTALPRTVCERFRE